MASTQELLPEQGSGQKAPSITLNEPNNIPDEDAGPGRRIDFGDDRRKRPSPVPARANTLPVFLQTGKSRVAPTPRETPRANNLIFNTPI